MTVIGVDDTRYGNDATYGNNGGRVNATAMGMAPQCWALPGPTRPSEVVRPLAYLRRPTHMTTTTTRVTARTTPGTAMNDIDHKDDTTYDNVLRVALQLADDAGATRMPTQAQQRQWPIK